MGQRTNSNPFLAASDARPHRPFEVATTLPALSPFAPAAPAPSGAVDVLLSADDATQEDAAPSRQDLLQRAAELGPARMTWESIVLPTDPILGAKMQPRVAERRARFRKIVKGALGACLAFCVVATAASALSSTDSAPATATATVKTAPATRVVSIEKLEVTALTKAPSKMTAAIRPTPAPKFAKRR